MSTVQGLRDRVALERPFLLQVLPPSPRTGELHRTVTLTCTKYRRGPVYPSVFAAPEASLLQVHLQLFVVLRRTRFVEARKRRKGGTRARIEAT